jgi:hypothetical protein
VDQRGHLIMSTLSDEDRRPTVKTTTKNSKTTLAEYERRQPSSSEKGERKKSVREFP